MDSGIEKTSDFASISNTNRFQPVIESSYRIRKIIWFTFNLPFRLRIILSRNYFKREKTPEQRAARDSNCKPDLKRGLEFARIRNSPPIISLNSRVKIAAVRFLAKSGVLANVLKTFLADKWSVNRRWAKSRMKARNRGCPWKVSIIAKTIFPRSIHSFLYLSLIHSNIDTIAVTIAFDVHLSKSFCRPRTKMFLHRRASVKLRKSSAFFRIIRNNRLSPPFFV